jgi:hypothetical protein
LKNPSLPEQNGEHLLFAQAFYLLKGIYRSLSNVPGNVGRVVGDKRFLGDPDNG